jgi:hypothetical protein
LHCHSCPRRLCSRRRLRRRLRLGGKLHPALLAIEQPHVHPLRLRDELLLLDDLLLLLGLTLQLETELLEVVSPRRLPLLTDSSSSKRPRHKAGADTSAA